MLYIILIKHEMFFKKDNNIEKKSQELDNFVHHKRKIAFKNSNIMLKYDFRVLITELLRILNCTYLLQ